MHIITRTEGEVMSTKKIAAEDEKVSYDNFRCKKVVEA